MAPKHLISAILFAYLTLPFARATVYDLKADWSDTNNPNGTWSYNEGSNPLPHVNIWPPGTFGQPAWAPSENEGDYLPAWMKWRSNTSPGIMEPGDIALHTTDFANGSAHGFGNVTWTSPLNGTADISGAVWMIPFQSRSNHWRLKINEVTVTEGDIASGDVYSRSSPFDLRTGSGGASVLTSVPISVGTVITLQFEKTSTHGYLVGVNLTINTLPQNPTPVAASIHQAAEIYWPTVAGRNYQVQSSPSLDNPLWSNFGPPIAGDGTEKSAFDKTRNAAKRFYRVLELP